MRIFKSNIITILLYRGETWRMTKAYDERLDTFLHTCPKRILKVHWPILWTAAAAVVKNRDKRRTFMSGPTPPRRKELSLGQSLQSHLPFVFLNRKRFLAKTILSSTFLVNVAIVLQIQDNRQCSYRVDTVEPRQFYDTFS